MGVQTMTGECLRATRLADGRYIGHQAGTPSRKDSQRNQFARFEWRLPLRQSTVSQPGFFGPSRRSGRRLHPQGHMRGGQRASKEFGRQGHWSHGCHPGAKRMQRSELADRLFQSVGPGQTTSQTANTPLSYRRHTGPATQTGPVLPKGAPAPPPPAHPAAGAAVCAIG